MSTKRPAPIIGFRRRLRVSAEPFLVGSVGERIVLEPGTELHLRRLHDGRLPTPEFAMQAIPPKAAPSKRLLETAAADRLDGSAVRVDLRDEHGDAGHAAEADRHAAIGDNGDDRHHPGDRATVGRRGREQAMGPSNRVAGRHVGGKARPLSETAPRFPTLLNDRGPTATHRDDPAGAYAAGPASAPTRGCALSPRLPGPKAEGRPVDVVAAEHDARGRDHRSLTEELDDVATGAARPADAVEPLADVAGNEPVAEVTDNQRKQST